MPQQLRDESLVVLRFGGGRNSRASEAQIDPLECTEGHNFILNPGNGEYRPRPPFDLVGTVPNGAEIRGFATLLKTDGSVSMLIQGGTNVYSWDGAAGFTLVGTVAANTNLRGPKEAIWSLTDKVLITDLSLSEEIHEWDGTTFQAVSFLAGDMSTSFGPLKAKYCVVENERAFFANIDDNGQSFPHLLVGSLRSNYLIISTGDRPSDSLSEEDPFFLPTPQLKPINGIAFAFGVMAISQDNGAFEQLSGHSAKDFSMTKLHDGSGASGAEAVVSTGNDVIYGAPGRIESLLATDKFGNVEWNDLSFKIQPDITDVVNWSLVYNPRVKRVYCFPEDEQECHVLHTDFIESQLSGWSKYITDHGLSFIPTATMLCRDPSDGLEYVFMGDEIGNIYRMEGTGLLGDGGTTQIEASRTSVMVTAPADMKAFNIEGWIEHRKQLENTATLRFLFQGENVFDKILTKTFSELSFNTPYGGAVYYGGAFYYGVAQENRLVRRIYGLAGSSNQFQVQLSVRGLNAFAITEQGIRFDTSN